MSKVLSDKVEKILLPGEIALWSGRPYRGMIFKFKDSFIFLTFWVIFCLGAYLYYIDGPSFTSVILLAGSFFFTIGRVFFDLWYRNSLTYIITNERIVIYHKRGFRVEEKLSDIHYISMSKRAKGRGTIDIVIFDEASDDLKKSLSLSFTHIKNVLGAYAILQKAHDDKLAESSP